MVQTLTEFFSGRMSNELAIFIISMLPIAELRGGLIAASILGIPWVKAAIICVIGNCIPIPIIISCVEKVLNWMKTKKAFSKIAQMYEAKALKGAADIIEKYPTRMMWALYIFVAIPLPMTGAWTGSLIAAFLNLPLRRSLPAIMAGVATAGVIMLLLAYAAPALLGLK
jgi:uncharacterized membrane protein